jgi:hypothetical protein
MAAYVDSIDPTQHEPGIFHHKRAKLEYPVGIFLTEGERFDIVDRSWLTQSWGIV